MARTARSTGVVIGRPPCVWHRRSPVPSSVAARLRGDLLRGRGQRLGDPVVQAVLVGVPRLPVHRVVLGAGRRVEDLLDRVLDSPPRPWVLERQALATATPAPAGRSAASDEPVGRLSDPAPLRQQVAGVGGQKASPRWDFTSTPAPSAAWRTSLAWRCGSTGAARPSGCERPGVAGSGRAATRQASEWWPPARRSTSTTRRRDSPVRMAAPAEGARPTTRTPGSRRAGARRRAVWRRAPGSRAAPRRRAGSRGGRSRPSGPAACGSGGRPG